MVGALAQVHGEGTDAYYDVEALAAGRSSLGRAERAGAAAVGEVTGKDVLHVQCHLGFDTSLWRAPVLESPASTSLRSPS